MEQNNIPAVGETALFILRKIVEPKDRVGEYEENEVSSINVVCLISKISPSKATVWYWDVDGVYRQVTIPTNHIVAIPRPPEPETEEQPKQEKKEDESVDKAKEQ